MAVPGGDGPDRQLHQPGTGEQAYVRRDLIWGDSRPDCREPTLLSDAADLTTLLGAPDVPLKVLDMIELIEADMLEREEPLPRPSTVSATTVEAA